MLISRVRLYYDPEYLVINQNGDLLGAFNLPDTEELMHVDKNRIYATSTTENGIQISVYSYLIE